MRTVGSLCTGYGGLEMGLQQAFGPMDVRWHAEVDPAASRVLKTHTPDVPNLGDITGIAWRLVEPVDILCAGIPCQPVSAAGLRRGADDERWLWQTGARPAIDELRPPVVFFENVANLARGLMRPLWDGVLDDFREMGYAVRWTIVGACAEAIGGCHHRHRLFALAVRHAGPARIAPAAVEIKTRCGVPRGNVLPTPTARDGNGRGEGDGTYWDKRRREGGRTNGKPLAAALLTMLPTPRAADGNGGGRLDRRRSTDNTLPQAVHMLPTPRATDGRNGGPGQRGSKGDLAMPSAVQPEAWGRYAGAVARWGSRFAPAPTPTDVGPKGGQRLAAAFPEWMMGLPAGHVTDAVDRLDALRIIGNGVMPQQAAHGLDLLTRDA